MENSTNKTHQTVITKQIRYDKMFYWRYDDKSYKSILYDTETGCTDAVRNHSNSAALNFSKNKCKSAGVEVVELEFNSGITKSIDKALLAEASDVGIDGLIIGYREMKKMLDCYKKNGNPNEIIRLLSLILSGYTARLFFHKKKKSTLYFSRAPIVLIRKSKDDLCGGFEHMERIARSLIVDTGYALDFDLKNPPVIPAKKRMNSIENSASARLWADAENHRFSTQYRDTAVLIHTNFFADKALRCFAERNKWATVLLFNKNKIEWARLATEVDLNKMTLSAWNWKPKDVRNLINGFVLWLSVMKSKENFEEVLTSWKKTAKKVVHMFNLASVSTRRKMIQGSEWDLVCLQIVSLYAFSKYLSQTGILDDKQCETLFDEWANTILPGSRGQKILDDSIQAERDEKDRKDQRIASEFESLVEYIVKYNDGSKIYPLERGEAYKIDPSNISNNLDLEADPWAFISILDKTDILVIKIRYKEIYSLAKEIGLLHDTEWKINGLKNVLSTLKEKNGEKSYVQSVVNVRLNISGEAKDFPGVTLIVDKMQFLDEDVRKQIKAKISGVK